MARQTLFPGIILDSIEASTGGGGRELSLDEGLPEDIDMERIQSFLSSVGLFGSDYVDSKLTYNLEIAAANPQAAKSKARSFVRAKNPFEPGFISVTEPEELPDMGAMGPGRNAYSVSATIVK